MAVNASIFLDIKGKSRIPLQHGQLYLVGKQMNGDGKGSKNFIPLEEEEDLNQRHCVIEISPKGDAYVFDLFSSKGTLLNNKLLKSLEKTLLRNGDVLNLGKNEIKYFHDRHEVSGDSSGFLEANKNISSPDSTSEIENSKEKLNKFLMPSVLPRKSKTPNKSLIISKSEPNTSKSSLNSSMPALNSRRSDSFTIPETQYCKPQNSLNASDLSLPESIHDDNGGKIKFNFGNLDSFDDDEFCIPETQEVLPTGGISNNPRTPLHSDILHKTTETKSFLNKESSNLCDNSEFRICTQDYNDGFGEEESVEGLHSQIIPLIKHQMIMLGNNTKCSNNDSNNQSNEELLEKDMSALKWWDTKMNNDTTEGRDCLTPDIFDFENNEVVNKKNQRSANVNNNASKTVAQHVTNILAEDGEDFLPTQAFPPPIAKKHNSLNDLEKPCLEKENEEVLTLSDKENRCPVNLDLIEDLQPTQIIPAPAVRTHTSVSCNNSSSIKPNTAANGESGNNYKSLLNFDHDESDDLVTEALLLPPSHTINSISNKNLSNKCFNSTLLDDKILPTNSASLFDAVENSVIKEISPASAFKKPEQNFSSLMKTSSATSDPDLDLLMCTPQLIKDNIFVGQTEDLKKNVLAAKNNNLSDYETDEEYDDDQVDLVKLINMPKDSLDFDKLLPHLNRRQRSKMSERQKAAKEALKIHKFTISFGKEQDEKQSKHQITKSSTISRDERHANRDKEKEVVERREQRNTNDKRSSLRREDKEVPDTDATDKTKMKERSNNSKGRGQKKINDADMPIITSKKTEQNITKKQDKTTRSSKRLKPSEKAGKTKESTIPEDKSQKLPAKRITRSCSRFEDSSSTNKELLVKQDDLDNIDKQPNKRVARRLLSPKQSHENVTSDSSLTKRESHKKTLANDTTSKKVIKRKRKAEELPSVIPAKVERKRSRSTHSHNSLPQSSSNAVSISMTMVDPEIFQNLIKNSRGFWNIAKNPEDCDLLVMDKPYRTFKFLLAMARGIPIVTSKYLKKLNETKSKKELRVEEYLFTDAEFEKKYKFSLSKSLQSTKMRELFKGYEFLMTASIMPKPEEIKAIIETSGGSVYDKNPPQPKENQQLYLVTAKEDKKEWHKYRRLNRNIIIVSTEAIMSAIMSQNCGRMASYTLA